MVSLRACSGLEGLATELRPVLGEVVHGLPERSFKVFDIFRVSRPVCPGRFAAGLQIVDPAGADL